MELEDLTVLESARNPDPEGWPLLLGLICTDGTQMFSVAMHSAGVPSNRTECRDIPEGRDLIRTFSDYRNVKPVYRQEPAGTTYRDLVPRITPRLSEAEIQVEELTELLADRDRKLERLEALLRLRGWPDVSALRDSALAVLAEP